MAEKDNAQAVSGGPGYKRPGQKYKSLLVWQVLLQRTDEEHPLSVDDIQDHLRMQKLRREVAAARTEQNHCIANWINVGCMMPWMDYTPRTLDEIIEREKMMLQENGIVI